MLDPSSFPKTFQMKNNRKIAVCPLKEEDQNDAMNFLMSLPKDELEYLWDDPSDTSIIRNWTKSDSTARQIPFLVRDEGRIVSIWTLGFGDHGWTRHLGYIWGIVDPRSRRSGIATVIVRELLTIAAQFEMERVVIELVQPQKGPISHFLNIGFSIAATLKEWVKDRNGRYHDLVVLTMDLEPAWRKMDEMLAKYDSHAS